MILGGAECVWSGRRRPATDTLVSIKYNNNIILAHIYAPPPFPLGAHARNLHPHFITTSLRERTAAMMKPSRASRPSPVWCALYFNSLTYGSVLIIFRDVRQWFGFEQNSVIGFGGGVAAGIVTFGLMDNFFVSRTYSRDWSIFFLVLIISIIL